MMRFKHKLFPIVAEDLRSLAIGHGQVSLGDKAPIRLIFVADIISLPTLPVIRNRAYKIPKFKNHITLCRYGLNRGQCIFICCFAGFSRLVSQL